MPPSYAILFLAALAAGGCLPWAGLVAAAPVQSIGTTSRGILIGADHLDAQGRGFRSYKAVDRRFGTRELVGLVERAGARVEERFPGTVSLVGDLSAEGGGFASGHASHRSGRDVDFAIFTATASGRPISGWPLLRFDRFGVAVHEDGSAARLDAARTWALVEALLTDPETDVQWIFASDGVKASLLAHAIDNGADLAVVERAISILHQPRDAAPHDDHLHVRVYCPTGDGGAMCADQGRRWEWIPGPTEGARPDDAALLRLALDGLDG